MTPSRLTLTRLALALLSLTATSLTPAGTVTWVGPDGGRWDEAANWSGGVLPTALDDVQLGSAHVVTLLDAVARSITSSGEFGGRFSNGNITLTTGGQFNRLSLVGSGARFTHSGLVTVTGESTLIGILGDPGTTRFEGATRIADSQLVLQGGHRLVLAGQTRIDDLNVMSFQNGSTLVQTGELHQTVAGRSLYSSGRIENQGSWTITGGEVQLLGTTFVNNGTLTLDATVLTNIGALSNTGVLNLTGGASARAVTSSGTVGGTGSIGVLTNAGVLAAGGTGEIGTLNITGNLQQQAGARLQLELGATGSDLLAVGGSATLGGTLSLSVLSGQHLARGRQFTVMTWGTRTAGSDFASLDFSQASGYRFATAYEANGLTLTVVAVPFTWNGAATGGFWDVARNWNDGTTGLPQAGDTVLLGSADTRIRTVTSVGDVTGTGSLSVEAGGHLVLGGTGSVGGLQLRSGSQLTNAGRLVATGDSSWVGSVLRGPGVTRIEGPFTIAGNFFDATPTLINGHTLELAGTTTYAGQRGLSVGDGATLVNQGTWVDRSPNDVTMGNFNGGTGRFLNQGTFTKASTSRTLIGEGTGMDFENTGTLNVEAGYLRLSSSRVSSTGTLDIAAGAELSLVSANATLGGQVVNQGTLGLDGGPLAIAGDLTLQGGGLTRLRSNVTNPDRLTVEGRVDWIDGALSGAGTTRMNGAVTISGASTHSLLGGQTLELAGTTTQTGTGSFSTGGGARVVNLGSWVEAASGNASVGQFNGGAATRFDNIGSFTKTSAFVTTLGGSGLAFNNTGLLDVQAGTLRFSGNATLAAAGQVRIAAGATLDLAASQVLLAGTLQNAGTLSVTGTLAVTDSAAVLGAGQTLLRGTLQNSGQLRLAGSTEWGQAVLRGSGTTRIEGPLTITGASGRGLIGGHTLELAGPTTQTGTGSINTGGGARIVNLGTWTEAANGNAFIGNFSGGAASRFDNAGRFAKTSAFVTDLGNGLVLDNTGRIDVQAGTLRLSEAFNNQGVIDIAAGAELASTVTAFANAGTLGGDGTVRTAHASLNLTNTGTLAAGGLGDAGTLSLIGGLTQQAGGVFLVDLGGTAAGSFDLLTVSGHASLAGTLAVNLLAGAQFHVGDSFTVMTWGQRLNDSRFASLDLSRAGGYSFAADYGANSLTLRVMTAPVPEPGSWALMVAGLAGLGLWTRRRAATTRKS